MGDAFVLTKGNVLFDSAVNTSQIQSMDQALDVSAYRSIEFQVNSIKLDTNMTSYTIRIMTAMQKDSDDYTWDQWTCDVTVSAAGATFVMLAPTLSTQAITKVLLRYIRWAVVNINGTGTSMFTIQGIARPG